MRARARSRIYAHLDAASARGAAASPIVNPPLWELAHIAWFQEFWCLRHGAASRAGERTPRSCPAPMRCSIPRGRARHALARCAIRRLRALRVLHGRDTLDATLEALRRMRPASDATSSALALLHEDMHGEALLMTLQTLGLPAPRRRRARPRRRCRRRPRATSRFAGGRVRAGHAARDEPRLRLRQREVGAPGARRAVRDAERTVTQGEFADFVEDDGYAGVLWSPRRQWRMPRARAPRYWKREAMPGVRRFDWRRWRRARHGPRRAHRGAGHCRCAARRLPMEPTGSSLQRGATTDAAPGATSRARCPPRRAVGVRRARRSDARSACEQMMGGVWEWTSSAVRAVPGLRAGSLPGVLASPGSTTTSCCAAAASRRARRLVHHALAQLLPCRSAAMRSRDFAPARSGRRERCVIIRVGGPPRIEGR